MDAEKDEKEELLNTVHEPGKNKFYVYPVRDWKEYLGESLLIIFSVLLALFVTEKITKLHEREKTKALVTNIVAELKQNRQAITDMQEYNMSVFARIDSTLADKRLQEKLVSDDKFNLNVIAPHGILYRYLENVAWTVARNNDIVSKVDIESISLLTKIYEDQDRISKVEEEVARVLFSRESRDPKEIRRTLILIRDIYHGWAADRIPGLLSQIDKTISLLEKKKY